MKKTIEIKSKWNTKLVNKKGDKPLTPKAGEDKTTIPRDSFFEIIKSINSLVSTQHHKETKQES